MKTSKILIAAGAALSMAGIANADLVVDTDLGALGTGSYNLTGDTASSGNSNANTYSSAGGSPGGWSYTSNEYVYQFTLSGTSSLSLTQNVSGSPDHDHFLLNSLSLNAGDSDAGVVGFIDETGAFGSFGAGTYYLSVDGWNGATGAYDFNLNIAGPAQAPQATVVGQGKAFGTLSDQGGVAWYSFDHAGGVLAVSTSETRFIDGALRVDDTEIGIYDSNGNLVATDDDIDFPDNPYSQWDGNLAAGKYYIAVGEYNVTFGAADWAVTSTSASYDGGQYSLRIVPTPGALAVMGLGGLVGLRRRR